MGFRWNCPSSRPTLKGTGKKDVEHKEHNMSTLFLQLTQVLMSRIAVALRRGQIKPIDDRNYNCYSCRNSHCSPTYCPGPAHSDNRARQIPLYCPCFGYSWVYRAITPPRGSSVSPWQLQPFTGSLINGSSKLGLVRIFVPLTGGLYTEIQRRSKFIFEETIYRN